MLLAALAFAGAAGAHLGQNAADDARVQRSPDHGAPATAHAALTEAGYESSTAFLGEKGPSLELGREGDGPLLRLTTRQTRTQLTGAAHRRSGEPAASRARTVGLSYLAFASALAEAKAGIVSTRSTAPPPPLFG